MDKYKEMMLYKMIFPIKKGNRTDLFSELKELREERDTILSSIPKDTRNKLNSIGLMCNELFTNININIINNQDTSIVNTLNVI